jgi:hypothetical protein
MSIPGTSFMGNLVRQLFTVSKGKHQVRDNNCRNIFAPGSGHMGDHATDYLIHPGHFFGPCYRTAGIFHCVFQQFIQQ